MVDYLKEAFEQMAVIAEAAAHKEPEEMTEDEKLAVCVTAGCEVIIRPVQGGMGSMSLSTKYPCGISRVGGKLQVFERKKPFSRGEHDAT